MPVRTNRVLKVLQLNKTYTTIALSSPPEKLIRNAVNPFIMKTKSDFVRTIASAGKMPRAEQTNIVIMLENPILEPGGSSRNDGIDISKKETTMDNAQKMATVVIVRVFFLLEKCLTRNTVKFIIFTFYMYANSSGEANCRLMRP